MTTITGGPGDDDLQGIGAGPYDIFGIDGNDTLRGGSYYDSNNIRRGHDFSTFDGGAGDDTFYVLNYSNIYGGDGVDTLTIDLSLAAGPVSFDLTTLWTTGSAVFGAGVITGI